MKCRRCQHNNPFHAKFCLECGACLAPVCAKCQIELPVGARFCSQCGEPVATSAASRFATPEAYTPKHLAEKILTSKTALEGERKQITVLFADLKGSMELLADRDPEEARKLLDSVVERMMEAVHRYEGTVNEVRGDGIMALFGAPLAHEDHAMRACFAALRMQEAVKRYADEVRRSDGLLVQIRVGLNSGEVVVRSIGSDLRMDYSAVGRTTHLAARMEQLAAPGSIQLTTETLRLVAGLIEVNRLGPMPIKGLGSQIEVFELVGAGIARNRLEAAAPSGLTRFVGRSAEMEQLLAALDRAACGYGQVVAVVGEPGVGKSRLVWEITHYPRALGWRVLRAGSVSYGRATPYLPLIDLLKGYFKIQDRDEVYAIREKVICKLLTLDESLKPASTALLALLDVPVDDAQWEALDPRQRRRRILDAIGQLLLHEAREQRLLLIFEDLHWIDGETQALLDSLVVSLPGACLVLLVNYRPEYSHTWGGKTYYRQLSVDPLSPESADELLDALLGTDTALGPLKGLLVARTEANPLFLEESVRSLVETGALAGERGAYRLTRPIEQLKMPATVQAILAARVDRLAPEVKRLLQAAAAIGKNFALPLLLAITDAQEPEVRAWLTDLQAAEFLYEVKLLSDQEYTFKHALTHEVTYSGLLHERRRELHARIVDAIESLYRDRLDEHIERLAHHAFSGALREKAVHYLRQAGIKAAARSALADARARFEQAISVLEALPESQSKREKAFETRLELRPVLNLLGELRRSLERQYEAELLAEQLNDDRRRALVCTFMTNIHSLLGEPEEALATGSRALQIAGHLGDLRLRLRATTYLEQAHYMRGDYRRVIELATDNLAALPVDLTYEYFGMPAPVSVYDRTWLALSLAQLGRLSEGEVHEKEAIRLAEPTHHAFTVGVAYRTAGIIYLVKGDWATARSRIEHGLAVDRTGNVALMLPLDVALLSRVLAEIGKAPEAANLLHEAEKYHEHLRASDYPYRGTSVYFELARSNLLLGRLDEARSLADRAVELSGRHPGFAARALHLLGDIATHPDRFDGKSAKVYYEKALALAESREMLPLIAQCHLGLGKANRFTSRRNQVLKHLTMAITMYREMGMTYWLEQSEAELRQLV